MKKIGIISDTHGCFDDTLRIFLSDVDEIWHAGDLGNAATADAIAAFKPTRAVCGNIDDAVMRRTWPLTLTFDCEGVRVVMTHIGFYGRRYDSRAFGEIVASKPKIFVCGHSHILRIFYDKKFDLLNINPGAAGCSGFHRVRTAVRFVIDGSDIRDMEVGEWPRG